MAEEKITKDLTFSEVIQKWPETAKVFLEHGMHCIGCPIAGGETIEDGARAHGIDVDKLIKELNKIMREKIKKR